MRHPAFLQTYILISTLAWGLILCELAIFKLLVYIFPTKFSIPTFELIIALWCIDMVTIQVFVRVVNSNVTRYSFSLDILNVHILTASEQSCLRKHIIVLMFSCVRREDVLDVLDVGSAWPAYIFMVISYAIDVLKTQDIVYQFPTYNLSPRSNNSCSMCAICQQDNDNASVALHCKHDYHRSCIEQWFKVKLTCPCCRQSVLSV